MKIKHDYKTGKTTIVLDWTETRQFISAQAAQKEVASQVAAVVNAKPKG